MTRIIDHRVLFDFSSLHQQPSLHQQLRELLIDRLPDHVIAYNEKTEFADNYIWRKTVDVVDDAKYIRYNTKKFINFIIIDIDDMYCETVDIMHRHAHNTVGVEPTWTIKTDRGYHVAYVVDNGVYATHKYGGETYDRKRVSKTKKELCNVLDADPAGSNRITGIWRNPAAHDPSQVIYTGKLCKIDELGEALCIDRYDENINTQGSRVPKIIKFPARENKINQAIQRGYHVGNRNNYIYAYGYRIKYENRSISDSSLISMMQAANRKQSGSKLSDNEVVDIAQSITRQSGTMYMVEKKRGRLSDDMWAKKIHGITNRRSYAGFTISQERRTKTIRSIINAAIHNISSDHINLSPANLAGIIGVSSRTVRRHMNKYGLLRRIWAAWLLTAPHKKIDIRPVVQAILVGVCTTYNDWSPPKVIVAAVDGGVVPP